MTVYVSGGTLNLLNQSTASERPTTVTWVTGRNVTASHDDVTIEAPDVYDVNATTTDMMTSSLASVDATSGNSRHFSFSVESEIKRNSEDLKAFIPCRIKVFLPKFHFLRPVTTQHNTLSSPCILAQEKVACGVALVGQHGATRSSRQARQARLARHVSRGVATAWTGVDMSTSLFQEVVPQIETNPEHERLSLYTQALLIRRRPPCWNKHGATRTTSATRACVSCRDVTQLVEFGLLGALG